MIGSQTFENFLNQYGSTAGRANQGFQLGIAGPGAQGPLQAGRAAASGQLLGQGVRGLTGPLAAGLYGLPRFMEGDIAGGTGATLGGIGTGMAIKAALPAIAAIPVVGGPLAVGTAIAAPLIGSKIGESILGGAARALGGTAQAAQTTIGTQFNPYSTPNVGGSAADDIMAQYELIRQGAGKDAADAYLRQVQGMQAIGDLDERRARTAMMVAPVRTAGRLAELGARGSYDLAGLGLQGTNQALANITAQNPYAAMLS